MKLPRAKAETRWSLVVPVAVFLAYLLVSLQYAGPAYLADEIGYLSKAAFLAGHSVDGASSYHAGYALFLAPLFYFFDDPSHTWTAIMVVNALMWAATFLAMRRILHALMPETDPVRLTMVLVLLALYPACLSMSGYAFSQTAFALTFSVSVLALLRLDPNRSVSVAPHALLAGFLYWVHPVGLAVGVASVITVAFWAIKTRRYQGLALHVALVAGMALAYQFVLDPWMVEAMTPAGQAARVHYPAMGKVLASLGSAKAWLTLTGLFCGMLAYTIVATFGFAGVGARHVMGSLFGRNGASGAPVTSLQQQAALLFVLLSVVGIIGMAAVSSASGTPDRMDHWIYGRYMEPVLLPLFGLGLLGSKRNSLIAVSSAMFLYTTGYLLQEGLAISGPFNVVNIPAFWPRLVFPNGNVTLWFLAAAAIVLVALHVRNLAMVFLAGIFAWSGYDQFVWHSNILASHSNPSEIPDFVERNYPSGTCVGFDDLSTFGMRPGSSTAERRNLYSYFLYDFDFRRMSKEAWHDDCAGPLLTYDRSIADKFPDVRILGRESGTSLYVVAKDSKNAPVFPRDSIDQPIENYWAEGVNAECVLSECLMKVASELPRFTQVGALSQGKLITSGKRGYLFFGPYEALDKGNYLLELRGTAANINGATLDITSRRGQDVHFRAAMDQAALASDLLARHEFSLDDDVQDLEFRLAVTEENDIRIESYSILPGPPTRTPRGLAGKNGAGSAPNTSASTNLKKGISVKFSSGGQGAPWLGAGWSQPEPWGVWSAGPSAVVELQGTNVVDLDNARLKFKLRSFVSDAYPTQRVGVSIDGGNPTWLDFRHPGLAQQEVSLVLPGDHLRQKNKLTIRFELPDAKSPQALGMSTDARVLGVGLESVELSGTELPPSTR